MQVLVVNIHLDDCHYLKLSRPIQSSILLYIIIFSTHSYILDKAYTIKAKIRYNQDICVGREVQNR